MAPPPPLQAEFFARPVLDVARDLLGRHLLRRLDGQRLGGRIVEVEAYGGRRDPASHAFAGPTGRNRVMFGPPGFTYVYFVYGIHHCFNLVCEEEGKAAAVLIRAIEPLEGKRLMAARREGRPRLEWTSGPARLCRALAIDRSESGLALPSRELWLEEGEALPAERLVEAPRVGVNYAGEAAAWPWRFYERGNSFVSKT